MIGSVERYSPAAGKRRAGSLVGRLVRVLLVALVIYLVVSRFLAGTYRIESVSMEPSLKPGDRVIVSMVTYGPRVPFASYRLPGITVPARGDLVVVQPPFVTEPSLAARILEPLASFLSLQKLTLFRDMRGGPITGYMVKRIVGVPGDTVRLSGFALSIRPRGASAFVPEQQLVPVPYRPLTALAAPGWSASLPLSGSGPETLLNDEQYYVLGDNRPDSSDSRSWGPIKLDRIVGKVVYRYWPPASVGVP